MESETREKLRRWSEEVKKLDDETKAKEAEVWCLSALSILEKDKDFRKWLEEHKL